MAKAQKNNKLRIMMIYGWQLNPYIEYVVQSLAKQGAEVLLVTRKTFDLTSQNELYSVHKLFPKTERTKLHHLMVLSILQCIALFKLAILVLAKKPHIVHFSALHIPYIDWVFFIFLKLLRIKTALTIHDTQSHQSSLDDLIMVNISRCCDMLFVHTTHSKNYVGHSALRVGFSIPGPLSRSGSLCG